MARSKVLEIILKDIENNIEIEDKVDTYTYDLVNKTYNRFEITSFKHNVRGNIMKKHLNGLFGGVETLNDMLNKNACVASGHYNIYSIKDDNNKEIIC